MKAKRYTDIAVPERIDNNGFLTITNFDGILKICAEGISREEAQRLSDNDFWEYITARSFYYRVKGHNIAEIDSVYDKAVANTEYHKKNGRIATGKLFWGEKYE